MGKAKIGSRHKEKLKQHKSHKGGALGSLTAVPSETVTIRAIHKMNVSTIAEIIAMRGLILIMSKTNPARNTKGKAAI